MSVTYERIRTLVKERNVRVSAHGYANLMKRGILLSEIMAGAQDAVVIEDYPSAHLGPSVLVLQNVAEGRPLHVVWGLEKDTAEPAVIVTAYHPDPALWGSDLRSRQ